MICTFAITYLCYSMYNLFLIVLFSALTLTVSAQNDIDGYLKNHHYAFDLESGFDKATQDTLSKKLAPYNVVVQAEGGSHALECLHSADE